MKTFRTCFAFAPLSLLTTLMACGGGGADPVDDGDAGVDGPLPVPACGLTDTPEEIALPLATIDSAIEGESRNPSTTCTRQTGTGGPEKVFFFRLAERQVVTLQVVSGFDTVLAVRKACDEALTEVACADGPTGQGGMPGPVFDAGFPMPLPPPGVAFPTTGAGAPSAPPIPDLPFPTDAGVAPTPELPPSSDNPLDASLRIALDPGVYFVIVDEAAPFGVGGPFTLIAHSQPPPASAQCRTAAPVSHGTTLQESLDLAHELAPACSGQDTTPAMFYAATIPSGQRLRASVTPLGGERPWRPVIAALSACEGGLCLGSGQPGRVGDEVLEYVNNGPAPITLLFAVSSDAPVAGALFQLSVRISAPLSNISCASPMLVKDGTVLIAQDLVEGGQSLGFCAPPGPGLFYRAELLPRQTLTVTATNSSPNVFVPVSVAVMGGCNGNCLANGGLNNAVSYTNQNSASQTVIIQVNTFMGVSFAPVDIRFSMSLPPGSVKVSTLRAPDTSEAGATSQFTVVLGAPPLVDVTVPIASLDTTEVVVSPAMLLFTPQNWDKPQTVMITGVDDDEKDGAQTVTVAVQPAVSVEARYHGENGNDVLVRNLDDEPGVTVDGAEALVTSEGGRSVSITVKLNRAPSADVTLPLSVDDTGEGKASPAVLVFTANDWSTAQTVTITGVDDTDKDGPQNYKLLLGAMSSTDVGYDGVDPTDLPILNRDNDFEVIAPQPLNVANMNCNSFGGFKRRVAIDEGGAIYVLLMCFSDGSVFPGVDGGVRTGAGGSGGSSSPSQPPIFDAGGPIGPQVFVAVSRDGGQTFAAPVPIGLHNAAISSIAAGRPGEVFVSAATPFGVQLVRSVDHGVRFGVPTMLGSRESFAPLADVSVAGSLVTVAGFDRLGGMVFSNTKGGEGAFAEVRPGFNGDFSIHATRDERTLWLFSNDMGAPVLRRSLDGGASFEMGRTLQVKHQGGTVAFGTNTVFGAGFNSLWVGSLIDFKAREIFLPEFAEQRYAVADEFDNLTVLEVRGGSLRALRLPTGATQVQPAKTVASSVQTAWGAALAENAVAVVFTDQNGASWFTLTTF